jgi:hypothetical protein
VETIRRAAIEGKGKSAGQQDRTPARSFWLQSKFALQTADFALWRVFSPPIMHGDDKAVRGLIRPSRQAKPDPRRNRPPNGHCWRLNALWARFRAVECLHPLGLLPEDAGAVELDGEAGEEGDQDKGDQIPSRMDRWPVAVFSHGARLELVQTGCNLVRPDAFLWKIL